MAKFQFDHSGSESFHLASQERCAFSEGYLSAPVRAMIGGMYLLNLSDHSTPYTLINVSNLGLYPRGVNDQMIARGAKSKLSSPSAFSIGFKKRFQQGSIRNLNMSKVTPRFSVTRWLTPPSPSVPYQHPKWRAIQRHSDYSTTCLTAPFLESNIRRNPPTAQLRVLITGGSRGIGLAIAQAFARSGNYSIQITGRNEETLKAAIQSVQESYKLVHPNATSSDLSNLVQYRQANVSNSSTWKSAFSEREGGKGWEVPDILVNSAGVTHSSLLIAMKASAVEHIIDTNLIGTIYACQSVSKAILRLKRSCPSAHSATRKNTCIINISSLLATHGGRGSSVYSASKAGVLGKHSQFLFTNPSLQPQVKGNP